MKVSTKWIRICNIACAVLLLALLACQLMPFWTMPACTCEGSCEPAENRFSAAKVDPNCKACSITYKWCVNLAPEYRAGVDESKLLDTSEDWTISIQKYIWLLVCGSWALGRGCAVKPCPSKPSSSALAGPG